MKLGILVAMEEEIRLLIEKLAEPQIHEVANQVFYDGTLYGIPVTLVKSGIGKVNASIATTLLIERFNVDAVINTGSAGGINEGLAIGDLVVATELSYNDTDNRVFNYTYGQIPAMPETYESNKKLNQRIAAVAESQDWTVSSGQIVTGDSFISSQTQIDTIKNHFPNALVTEMEGAAVAQTCYQFDVPFTVIRAVSDAGDESASVDFDEFVVLAGKRSAELVLAFIKKYAKEVITEIIEKYSK